jgi:hypothetical protein
MLMMQSRKMAPTSRSAGVKGNPARSAEYRERYGMILGDDYLTRKLSILFRRDNSAVRRWFQDGVPYYAILVLELLEVLHTSAPWFIHELNSRIARYIPEGEIVDSKVVYSALK